MVMKHLINAARKYWRSTLVYYYLLVALGIARPLYGEMTQIPLEQLIEQATVAAKEERFEDALKLLNQAYERDSKNIDVIFKLGYVHLYMGNVPESLVYYLTLTRNCGAGSAFSSLYNIAYILKISGRVDEAIKIFEKLIQHIPDYECARLGYSFGLISKGLFAQGWQAHKWNLVKQGKSAPEFQEFVSTNNLAGKRILLIPEGGLGDTLNFIRYGARLKELGAYVISLVQRPLFNLLQGNPCFDEVITAGLTVPAYDARVTYMSVPVILGGDEDAIPKNVPYVFPHEILVKKWAEYFHNDRNFKIGLCWQADVHNDSSRIPMARRGIPLKLLEPLGSIPGISWYSLQKKDGLEELNNISDNFKLQVFDETFDEKYGSFMDTAAVIAHLDLVITIDSAIAHLAGAMGARVWLLLPYSSDWRWVIGRSTTPWYPTMTIFKQPLPFDWHSIVKRLEYELRISTQLKNI